MSLWGFFSCEILDSFVVSGLNWLQIYATCDKGLQVDSALFLGVMRLGTVLNHAQIRRQGL